MKPDAVLDPIEAERYELREEPPYRFGLARREFLKTLGGGILVLLALDPAPATGQRGGGRRGGSGQAAPQSIDAWLHVAEDGTVTAYTGKAEVGQNIRTSLSQVVAEELRLPLDSIRLVMADTDRTPFDMGTFGSRTTPAMAPQLRRMAAGARELLVDLAAAQWQTDRAALRVEGGRVTDPHTGQSIAFGPLTKGQQLVKTVDGSPPATPAAQWKVGGTSVPKVDGRAMVTGGHRFASDVRREGMLYGRVLRPPSFNAALVSLQTRAAEAVPGAVVVRDGEFAGVAAPDEQLAARALAALQAEWNPAPAGSQPSHRDLYDHLRQKAAPAAGPGGRSSPGRGDLEAGMAAADRRLEGVYRIAYIAHAPLEPRAAVAEWNQGKLTVWTGTQRPFGVRSELAAAFRLPEERVRVIVPDTGAGYGGKHTGEAALEAARLAKAAGRPVKLVWTREEEFTWAYFRPAGVIEVATGVRNDGSLVAWEFHNYNSGGAGLPTPYEVPNQRVEFHAAAAPLRQGSYRALAATANHFARESHMDDLARAVGMDPLAFRLKNLKDARLQAVLQAAAGRFGWSARKPSAGRGMGIACGFEKGSYVATCAEVTLEGANRQVRVARVVTAFDCGAVVNPDHLENQVQGATVMGIGGALFEAVEFEEGRVLNPRFSRYRVPRFSDAPAIEVALIDRKDVPSAGAGETPIVAVAPAIGNAIFDAARVRLRSLPMAPDGVKS
jgi:nicotinate dehydrogenase subunit B